MYYMYYTWALNPNMLCVAQEPKNDLLSSSEIKIKELPGNNFSSKNKIEVEQLSKNQNNQLPKRKKAQKSFKDEDYEFFKKQQKVTNGVQRQGRNIISNILRSFFKFIETSEAQKLLEKICQHLSVSITKKKLMKLFQVWGIHSRNYIRLTTVKKMLQSSENLEYVGVFKFALHHYLIYYAKLHFLNSQKLKQANRFLTLQQIRVLEQELFHNLL